MAGMGTRDIKRKIKSVNSTMQITKAMELVSTAKLRRSRERMDITKPYFETVYETVQTLMRSEKSLKHEFLEARPVSKTLYVVITGDRGLCGGYNSNILKLYATDSLEAPSTAVLAVGKKAGDFFTRTHVNMLKNYVGIAEMPSFSDAQDIARRAIRMYADAEVDSIKLLYTRFKSTVSQEATCLTLLPFAKPKTVEQVQVDEAGEPIEVTAEQPAAQAPEEAPEDFVFIEYEPNAEAVLDYMIPKYIESTLYGALIESAAAQQAAIRLAMESATDNAEEMIEALSLSYNQARQAAITQEISEIVGGAEALK